MSGVATLKIRGAKRHFDEMAVDIPLQPQACSPGRYPLRPPPLKRGRCAPSPSPSPISTPLRHQHQQHNQTHSLSNLNSSANTPLMPPAPPPTPSSADLPMVTAHDAKHLLTKLSSSPGLIKHHAPNDSAASKLDVKLNFDQPSVSSSPAPHAHHLTSSGPGDTANSTHTQRDHSDCAPRPASHPNHDDHSKPSDVAAPSQSEPVVVSADELAALARHLPRRLKRVYERLSAGQVTASERLFTLSDLREIVNSVLAESEGKLRDQFTVTLNERLAEQFRDFTKFNEDYVSRQLRGTDVAYLS